MLTVLKRIYSNVKLIKCQLRFCKFYEKEILLYKNDHQKQTIHDSKIKNKREKNEYNKEVCFQGIHN